MEAGANGFHALSRPVGANNLGAVMVDIFPGISAFNGMLGAAKALKDINDTVIRNQASIDLQGQILTAQEAYPRRTARYSWTHLPRRRRAGGSGLPEVGARAGVRGFTTSVRGPISSQSIQKLETSLICNPPRLDSAPSWLFASPRHGRTFLDSNSAIRTEAISSRSGPLLTTLSFGRRPGSSTMTA